MIPREATKRILALGQVFVDRHLDAKRIRLGGLFHVARAFDALECNYAAAYICPSYLDADCAKYFSLLNAIDHRKIGEVIGAPNVVEIGDSAEGGNQSYNDLLKDSRKVLLDLAGVDEMLSSYQPTDVLVIGDSNECALVEILARHNSRLHVDTDHDYQNLWCTAKKLSTVFCSTSGASFKRLNSDPAALRQAWETAGSLVTVLKENRGGSRVFVSGDPTFEGDAPAFPTATQHSVGVGDCFNATWVSGPESESARSRLRWSSYISSLYASTFDHTVFVKDVRTATTIYSQIKDLRGVRIPWERRPHIHIYLAAPDFPHIDTSGLDELSSAIRYHNFSVRRPVQENGLAQCGISHVEARSLFSKDTELLERCQMLIAIPLTEDPGTYTELGWFASAGKPTILYDPQRRANNFFSLNVATRVCSNVGSVIDALFELLGGSEDA